VSPGLKTFKLFKPFKTFEPGFRSWGGGVVWVFALRR
jgi:hypothetical protein